MKAILRRLSPENIKRLNALLCQYLTAEEAEVVTEIILMHPKATVLVDGRQNPTGKTTLIKKLKKLGFNARQVYDYALELAQVQEARITSEQNQNSDENYISAVINLNKYLKGRKKHVIS